MKQAPTPMFMEQSSNSTKQSVTGKSKLIPARLLIAIRFLLVSAAFWLMPAIAKADTPIPTSIVSSYDAVLHRLTLTVHWSWPSVANGKFPGAAVFADLNGDGIKPSFSDDPATYNSGGNPFPAGLSAKDEFLGQLASSNINGSATSAMFPAISDNTDNGYAFQNGFGPDDPRMLLPYGTTNGPTIGTSGVFTMTFDNVTVAPTLVCVVMYDVHSGNLASNGDHSLVSAEPHHNGDNSVEKGNTQGTVSCAGSVHLNCAVDKTEASCQTQAAIDASYNAWLNSVTGSGCNGVLTNNSTGAPPACGGFKIVTWTYTQSGCPNQAATTTCSARFTVTADNIPPTFTNCPAGGDLGCNPSSVPPAGTATATDNCPNSTVTITNSLGPITSNGSQRQQIRTYTATDACGNSSTCQQIFTWHICPNAYPDFNVTYVNVPVPGNVSTNDQVPAGTTYSNPSLTSSPAGSTQSITLNSDGTYTFVADKKGIYKYDVQYCVPGAIPPCPTTVLTITVLDKNSPNPPVANDDIAVTKMNVAVVLKTLANDKAGNSGNNLVPSTVIVTSPAGHGSTSINPGNGDDTYTPNSGYVGNDQLTYQVCDDQSPSQCATAKQYIYIKSTTEGNSTFADDDYNSTKRDVPVSGNVKINDTDPEGDAQTVTAQTTTVAGKGTLVLNAAGNYTFTPVAGYVGPVSFPYTTTDNGTPIASASATLYILVTPPDNIANPDFNVTYVNVSVPGNVSTNDVVPGGSTYCSFALVSSPAGSTKTLALNSDGTYTFISNKEGVYVYNVTICLPGGGTMVTLLTITVLNNHIGTNPPVANTDIAYTKQGVPVILKTLANDKAGNPGGALVPSSVVVTVAAANGTTSINAVNGDDTYTPNAGFIGWDVLTYQVCDNSTPSLCATAKQYIYVGPTVNSNTTFADDDYAYTPVNTAVSGNVKTNDTDPEGNAQTVTAQTTTAAGKGTLVLASDGSYTFTPVNGFTGPVSFVYTTCDNGSPVACAFATLYILVSPLSIPDFTPSNDIDALSFSGGPNPQSRDFVVNITEVLNSPSTGQVVFRVRKISAFNITYNVNATTANVFGGEPVNNSDWLFTEDANFITLTLKPGKVINGFNVSPVGFTITRKVGIPVNTTQNITVTIITGSGGDSNSGNNQAVTSITAN